MIHHVFVLTCAALYTFLSCPMSTVQFHHVIVPRHAGGGAQSSGGRIGHGWIWVVVRRRGGPPADAAATQRESPAPALEAPGEVPPEVHGEHPVDDRVDADVGEAEGQHDVLQPHRGGLAEFGVGVGDSALNARWSPAHYERRDDGARHHQRPHASLGESVDAGATKRHSVAIVTRILTKTNRKTHLKLNNKINSSLCC